jgi:hypothetical protein
MSGELNKFYFAYGSLMSLKEMKQTCEEEDYEVVGPAKAEGYELAFTRKSRKWNMMGVADLKPSPSSLAYGVLYKISDKEKQKIDIREGYAEGRDLLSNAYNCLPVIVKLINSNQSLEAICYFANRQADFIQPSRRYLDIMIKGAQENGLPEEAVLNIKEKGKYDSSY